jgi:polysaccharide export outer membrane protein
LIIREVTELKHINRVDITKADFINSPFYYLGQNDVVYVEPNKNKINGAAVGPNTCNYFLNFITNNDNNVIVTTTK